MIRKAAKIKGRTLMFRNAAPGDAEFIVALRTDTRTGRFLSATSADVKAQAAWLEAYAKRTDEAYFIIENLDGEPYGTVRIYDAKGDSFCWGSWILSDHAPSAAAIESALMVYAYAIDVLGFGKAHFDVRKENERVWQFHERFGAVRVREAGQDFFYTLSAVAIEQSRRRYARYLPHPIYVEDLA